MAVYVKQGSGSWQLHYICRDYLGSITHLADSNGSLTQELSFDAWGRLRDPANQTAYAPGSEPELFLGRGYTGHEHLNWFGLVNMNGRLYDPAVGRFLSPDNYVQLPDFSQNLNRYSYALNNPLKFNDPDGEFFWFAVAIGAVLNVTSRAISGKIDNFWDAFGAAAIGGLAGAAGYGAFAQFGGTVSFLSGAASGGAGGFVGGAGNAWLDGAGFGQGLLSGLVGGVSGAAIGGITSGVSASLKGNNFWNGTPTDRTVAKVLAAKVASPKLADSFPEASLNVGRTQVGRMPESMRPLTPLSRMVETSDSYYNKLYAQEVKALAGKPYVYGSNGPDSFDCSSTVCYGIRNVKNPKFGDYTAQQLFDLHTVSTTSRDPGILMFYDWGSNGSINHVTSIIGNGQMLHPSSGSGILQIISTTKLNNVNNPTIYFRQIKW